jgi:pyruvate/2-oxoglutarate dehydrogenase complex dihydrolipoamide acyltransferase (E2) component
VVVPKQSPTDEEASVVRFHVQPGQAVKVGTLLAEMEANKGSFEVDCPHPGTVVELVAREGQRVRIGGTLLYLELPEEMPLEGLPGLGEPSAAPVVKEIRLSPAQLQVGALALKSRAEIPCVSVDMEVDLTALAPQREALQAEFERRWGLHVSYTHLLLWAMTQAMKESRNEGFRGRLDPSAERLLIGPHVNVAFAVVGRNEDLYSPVIKRSDQLTLRQLVQRAQELTAAVRTGSIGVGELQGASVTLTNIGPLQAAGGMPFVIPGQLAMLASGALTDLPRYVQAPGRPEPELQRRKILKLTLVFDHRPFNGTHAVGFLDSIKRQLEPMDLEAHLRKG